MVLSGVNYAEIILDEVCLEGLDGITLQGLWVRLADRFEFEIPNPLKKRFWNILVSLKDVNFFSLPEPRADLEPFQRFEKVDDTYVLKPMLKEDPQSAIYPYVPVKDAHGSCKFFESRVDITSDARQATIEVALERWGNSLVAVGTLEARWKALAPCSPPVFDNITRTQFSLLERIGRTRYNGETSVGAASSPAGEDPKTLFHLRKILLRLKLIKKRPFTQRDLKNNVNCRLLHLPRFHRPYMSNIEKVIEAIVELLKKKPNRTASYHEIRQFLLSLDDKMNAKNVLKLAEFTKLTRTVLVSYRELYPDAKSNETSNANNGADRQIRAFQLIEQEETQDDQDAEEWEVAGSGLVGESLLRQVYLIMREAGPAGITQREVCEKLGLDSLTARLTLKHLGKRCEIHQSMIDIRRQRMTKYTCPEFVGRVSEEFVVDKNKRQPLPSSIVHTSSIVQNSDESMLEINAPPIVKTEHDTNIEEEGRHKDVDNPLFDILKDRNNFITATKLRRATFIMEQLRQRHIIYDINNLLKICNRQEAQAGFKNGIIHVKTIIRILTKLESQGQLRLLHIKLGGKFPSPKLTFICEPHIDATHSYIQSVVEQAKMVYVSKASRKLPQEVKSKNVSQKISDIRKHYGYVPKFSKTRILHEFLFYIIYGHENKKGHLHELVSEDVIKDLSESEISTAYENAPDKYLFVPPVPVHVNWPKGWMLLADILLCMPLHIFMKLVRVTVITPTLVDYIKHPLKCQILVKNLPIDIQNAMFTKRRHIFAIYEVTQRLCLLGLLKFGQRLMKDKDRVFIFLNRKASLLDTSVSAPSYVTTEIRPYAREFFHFQSGSDLTNYWNRLQIVCLNTQLGFAKLFIGKQVEIQNSESKMVSDLRCYSIEEVAESDNGDIPGDGRGAGGLDSSLFAHIRRSWLSLGPIKPIKRKQAEKMSSQMSAVPRKKPKLARGDIRAPSKKKGKYIIRTVVPRKTCRVRKPFYDDIDKQALKNLTSARSSWQPKEDRILLLSKTAIGIMFSNPRLAPSSIIRDMLHAATHIADKTAAACRRRLLYMTKNPQISHNIHLCLAEVKQNAYVLQKYSQYYSRNRVTESSDKYPQFAREYKIHFIELVQYLHKIMYVNTTEKSNSVVLPQNVSDLQQKYFIDISNHSAPNVAPEPKDITEVKQNTLTCVIHSALSCKGGKKAQPYRLLQIYRQFPESFLQETILKVKSSGMFAMTKKYKENECVSSSFHLSQSYLYQLCTAAPYTMYAEAFSHYRSMIQNQSQSFTPEVLDSGAIAILFDLNSVGLADLELTIPENLLIIDHKKSEKGDSSIPEQGNSSLFLEEDKMQPSRISFSSLQLMEMPTPHAPDVLVNSCDLNVTLNCDPQDVFDLSKDEMDTFITNLKRDAVYIFETTPDKDILSTLSNCDTELAEIVFKFIDEKLNLGAAAKEIKNFFNTADIFALEKVLFALKRKNLIFRVGIANSRWVSKNHFYDWFIKIDFDAEKTQHIECPDNITEYPCMMGDNSKNSDIDVGKRKREETPDDDDENSPKKPKYDCAKQSASQTTDKPEICGTLILRELECFESETVDGTEEVDISSQKGKKYLCPSPWITPDGTLNLRILWRWAGALLCYLISHPLIELTLLQKHFTYMTPFHIRILVEITSHIGCTQLILVPTKKPNLWDNERCTRIIKEKVSILDDNEEVYVEVLENAITKFSVFKGYSMKHMKTYFESS